MWDGHCAMHLSRALEGGLELLPDGFRLLPVVPVECYERAAEGIVISSIFAAVETNPADKFSIGALGQWQPVFDLLKQVWDPDPDPHLQRRYPCSAPVKWQPQAPR